MDFAESYKKEIEVVNTCLNIYLPPESQYPQVVHQAMRYSVLQGGKRLRPILLLSAYKLFRKDTKVIMPLVSAIEFIHCFSLIHDDLPSMDNDEYRRGRLTNHMVFGEGIALLAGDGLLNYAYELIIKTIINCDEKLRMDYIYALNEIAVACGITGMIGGQVVDIISEDKIIEAETMDYIHTCKTGALIRASVKAGAIMGRADQEQIRKLDDYAVNIGLAFQIKDDLLDILGDESKLGKSVGSDKKKNKATYPVMYGMEGANQKLWETIEKAKESISDFGDKASLLMGIADYIATRES